MAALNMTNKGIEALAVKVESLEAEEEGMMNRIDEIEDTMEDGEVSERIEGLEIKMDRADLVKRAK